MARLSVPYLAFGLLKRLVPLRHLARWAWRRPAGPRDRAKEAEQIRCAVRLRRLLGGERGDCVQGSLALYRALSRAGAAPVLVVGFRTAPGALRGHAWVVVDGAVVAEPAPAAFTPTLAFGEAGRPMPPPAA
jgi:hypothetical protein